MFKKRFLCKGLLGQVISKGGIRFDILGNNIKNIQNVIIKKRQQITRVGKNVEKKEL